MCGRSLHSVVFRAGARPGRREGQFRSGFRLSGCYRRGVLSRALRPGIAALAAAGLAATGCSGSNQPPEVGPSGPSSTVVTSTTMIASAGVLETSAARRVVRGRTGPARRPTPGPVDHAAGKADVVADRCGSWCWPATNSTRCARWDCSRGSSRPRCPTGPTASRGTWEP